MDDETQFTVTSPSRETIEQLLRDAAVFGSGEIRYHTSPSIDTATGIPTYTLTRPSGLEAWIDQTIHSDIVPQPTRASEPDDSESIEDYELTQYLNQLCSQTGRNFAQINLDDFRDCETKNDVNKVFFSALWSNKEIPVEKKYEIEVETLFKLANPLAKLTTGIRDHRRYASEALDNHNSNMRDLVDLERQVDLFKPAEPGFYWDMVKTVTKDGRWTLAKVTSDKIVFNLTNDCFLRWHDPGKQANLNVNMGKYSLSYQPNNNRIRITTAGNNIVVDSYFHPHINGNGEVCWGNAKFQINKAMCQFDLVKICELSFLLLHEYNAASPFVRLGEFEKARNYEISNRVWVFNRHIEMNRIHFRSRVFNSKDWVHENKMYKLMQIESWRLKGDDSDDRYIYANDNFIKLNPSWCFFQDKLSKLNWPQPDYVYPANEAPANDSFDNDDEPEEAEED